MEEDPLECRRIQSIRRPSGFFGSSTIGHTNTALCPSRVSKLRSPSVPKNMGGAINKKYFCLINSRFIYLIHSPITSSKKCVSSLPTSLVARHMYAPASVLWTWSIWRSEFATESWPSEGTTIVIGSELAVLRNSQEIVGWGFPWTLKDPHFVLFLCLMFILYLKCRHLLGSEERQNHLRGHVDFDRLTRQYEAVPTQIGQKWPLKF